MLTAAWAQARSCTEGTARNTHADDVGQGAEGLLAEASSFLRVLEVHGVRVQHRQVGLREVDCHQEGEAAATCHMLQKAGLVRELLLLQLP